MKSFIRDITPAASLLIAFGLTVAFGNGYYSFHSNTKFSFEKKYEFCVDRRGDAYDYLRESCASITTRDYADTAYTWSTPESRFADAHKDYLGYVNSLNKENPFPVKDKKHKTYRLTYGQAGLSYTGHSKLYLKRGEYEARQRVMHIYCINISNKYVELDESLCKKPVITGALRAYWFSSGSGSAAGDGDGSSGTPGPGPSSH